MSKKWRQLSADFKFKVALETTKEAKTLNQLASASNAAVLAPAGAVRLTIG